MASTGSWSQLMAAIYDKALKHKDFSGIVNKDTSKEALDPDGKKYSKSGAKAKEDNPKCRYWEDHQLDGR
jgi:hypothetical protein